jgi:recombination protein RecT
VAEPKQHRGPDGEGAGLPTAHSRSTPDPARAVPAHPAATVVLVREQGGVPELLLLQRASSGFAPGAWVFPGGVVDSADGRVPPPDPSEAAAWARRMRLTEDGLAWSYVVAGIRETWEETGILIGDSPAGPERQWEVRRALLAGEYDYAAASSLIDLSPSPARLHYLARWVTPPTLPRRYDTRFFLSAVSPELDVRLEGGELLDAAWMRPTLAIERFEAGDLSMMFPTIHTIRRIAAFDSVDAMIDAALRTPAPEFLPSSHREPLKD